MSPRRPEDRVPTHVLRALEAFSPKPHQHHPSALAMGEQQSYDTLYQVLEYPLPRFFILCLQMCRATREATSLSSSSATALAS